MKKRATRQEQIKAAVEMGMTAEQLSHEFRVTVKHAQRYWIDGDRENYFQPRGMGKPQIIKPRVPRPQRQDELKPGQEALVVREWVPEWQRVYLNRHPRRAVEYRILEVNCG